MHGIVYIFKLKEKGGKYMVTKIKRALLNTKLAAKLIDQYLSKRSIIQIANSINKD